MKKILLVDDSPLMQERFQRALEEYGHEVTVASSLEQACDLIAQWLFDVLITDTNLQWKDTKTVGWVQVAEVFREKFPTWTIIAMSFNKQICWILWQNCDNFFFKVELAQVLLTDSLDFDSGLVKAD